jgi:diadenosine tetraphosphate (Ap4A) HIT family hydrolase
VAATACPLCDTDGGAVIWRDARLRVVAPHEPDYPAYVRVIAQPHLAEMTDLPPADREHLMAVVLEVERAMRDELAPAKVNLASFGNVVPHLHWHVIPRWPDDRHFPQPVWGAPAQGRDAQVRSRRDWVLGRSAAFFAALAARLHARFGAAATRGGPAAAG